MRTGRSLYWTLPLALASVGTALLGAGFALALTGSFGERLGPAPIASLPRVPRAGDAFPIVALGDSITHGTGDARGQGYAARVAEALRRRLAATLSNLAVPGAETDDLLRRLQQDEARRAVKEARLILVSIGGNDLTHAFRRDTDTEPDNALAAARTNLRTIVTRLREANPTAPIRLIGLYNPFEVLPSAEAEARAQLAAWNSAIEAVTHPFRDVLAIPIADLFADRPDRLAGDRFHPGSRGHAAIAERVLSSLVEAER